MSLHQKHLKEAPTSQGKPFPRNRIKYLPTFSWADFIGLGIFIPGMSDFFFFFFCFFGLVLLVLFPSLPAVCSICHLMRPYYLTTFPQVVHVHDNYTCLFVQLGCPTLIYRYSTLFCIYIATIIKYKHYAFDMITIGEGESVAYYVELGVLRLLAKTTLESGSKTSNRSKEVTLVWYDIKVIRICFYCTPDGGCWDKKIPSLLHNSNMLNFFIIEDPNIWGQPLRFFLQEP